jgi:hypothetical protein
MRKWLIGGVLLVAALAIGAIVVGPRLSGSAVKAAAEAALASFPPEAKLRHGELGYETGSDRLILDTLAFTVTDSAGRPVDLAFEGIALDGLKPLNARKVFDPAAYEGAARDAAILPLAERAAARRLVVTSNGETVTYADVELLKPAARQFSAPPPRSLAELRSLDPARVEDMVRAVTWAGFRSGTVTVVGAGSKEVARAAGLAMGPYDGSRLARFEVTGLAAAPENGTLALDTLWLENLDVAALAALRGGDDAKAGAAFLAALAFEKAALGNLSFADTADGSSGRLGALKLNGVGGARAQAIGVSDFTVKTADGALQLGGIRLTGLDASRLQAALAEGREDVSGGAVRLAEYEMTALSVALPHGGPVTVARVAVNGVTYADDVPTAGVLTVDDVKVPVTAIDAEEDRRPFVEMGYADLVFDLAADYAYDPGRKLVDLRKVELSMADGGVLSLAAAIDGLAPDAFGGNPMAAMAASADARIRTVELSYADKSLVRRAIAFAAKEQGTTPAAIVADARRALEAEAKSAKGNVTREAIRSIVAFLENPGRIVLRVAPSQPIGMNELEALGDDPDLIAKALNLKVVAEAP